MRWVMCAHVLVREMVDNVVNGVAGKTRYESRQALNVFGVPIRVSHMMS